MQVVFDSERNSRWYVVRISLRDWSARIIRLTGWMPIRADASMSNPKPKTGERSQKHSRTGTTPISDSISNRARYEIGSSAHNLL